MPRQRSSAAPLALAYTALLLYASLYPFLAWRWPPGLSLEAMLALPWPPWRDRFDVWSNVLGYLPLGLLLYVAQVRGGRVFWQAALLTLAAGSAVVADSAAIASSGARCALTLPVARTGASARATRWALRAACWLRVALRRVASWRRGTVAATATAAAA